MDKGKVYLTEFERSYSSRVKVRIRSLLKRHGYEVIPIQDANDIWCRDFMPVRGAKDLLVQFRYAPSYLESPTWRKTITPAGVLTNQLPQLSAKALDIKLDGGAVEILYDRGIISDRVFSENGIKEDQKREDLITRIRTLLGLSMLTVIPHHPDDFTGHVDGLVRFVDSSTVLVNDLSKESQGIWVHEFLKAIDDAGYKTEVMPYRAYTNKGDDARGIYMNFLKLPDLIIMPTFTYTEDKQAKDKLMEVFPNHAVETVYASDLAKRGGIINCMTWN